MRANIVTSALVASTERSVRGQARQRLARQSCSKMFERHMTPEEFRAAGHRIVDWIADYRARVGHAAGDGARANPATSGASCLPEPPTRSRAVRRDHRRPRSHRHAGAVALAASAVLRLLPQQRLARERAGRLRQHRPRRARPGVAVEPGADRGRGGRHRLDAADGRAVRRVERRHPGHGVDEHADRARSARASDRPTTVSRRGGLQSQPQPLVVYASAHSHSSVDKAALLAGFGRDNVRHVPHDAEYAMRPDALADAIARDRRAGLQPCAVVATTGTTTSTALDPIDAIAAIAARENGCGCTWMPRWPARR